LAVSLIDSFLGFLQLGAGSPYYAERQMEKTFAGGGGDLCWLATLTFTIRSGYGIPPEIVLKVSFCKSSAQTTVLPSA